MRLPLFTSLVFLILLFTSAYLVRADNCKPGLDYCGWNLLKRDNYYTRISTSLRNSSQPLDDAHVNTSLFRCIGGQSGAIEFQSFCGEDAEACQDGGTDRSDYCAVVGTGVVSGGQAAATATLSMSVSTSVSVEAAASWSTSQAVGASTVMSTATVESVGASETAAVDAVAAEGTVSHRKYVATSVGIGVGVTVLAAMFLVIGVLYARRRHVQNADGVQSRTGKAVELDGGAGVVELAQTDIQEKDARREERVHELSGEDRVAGLK